MKYFLSLIIILFLLISFDYFQDRNQYNCYYKFYLKDDITNKDTSEFFYKEKRKLTDFYFAGKIRFVPIMRNNAIYVGDKCNNYKLLKNEVNGKFYTEFIDRETYEYIFEESKRGI